jgi:hypothetical protein
MARRPLLVLCLVAGCSRSPVPGADAGPGALGPETEARAAAAGGRASVEGIVRRSGPPRPALPRLGTNASVERVCGATVLDGSLQVDAAGGVADVVVWLEARPEPAVGGPAEVQATPVLDQRGCRYLPPVIAARTGSTLRIRNSDPLTHTVHGVSEDGRTEFNLAMPLERMELVRTLPARPGTILVRCDVHPWMRAWVRTFEHPYFTVSDAGGRFRLLDLPAGAGELRFWHPVLGEGRRSVQLAPGTRIELEMGGER